MFKEIRKEIGRSGDEWRKIAEARRFNANFSRLGKPASPMESLADDLKVELSVLGHQILLVVMIAVANIVFFGLLILALPYIFRWLF